MIDSLPRQIELKGVALPDPIHFQISLPSWCPMDEDGAIALQWWGGLSAHLHVLLAALKDEGPLSPHQLVDSALRQSLEVVRDLFGQTVSAAISVAGLNARESAATLGEKLRCSRDLIEMGCWTMSLQTSFGLACVEAAAKGTQDRRADRIAGIYETVRAAFGVRMGDCNVCDYVVRQCTGTATNTITEKLEQWRQALAQAAEGLPDGVEGVAEMVNPNQPKSLPSIKDALEKSQSLRPKASTHANKIGPVTDQFALTERIEAMKMPPPQEVEERLQGILSNARQAALAAMDGSDEVTQAAIDAYRQNAEAAGLTMPDVLIKELILGKSRELKMIGARIKHSGQPENAAEPQAETQEAIINPFIPTVDTYRAEHGKPPHADQNIGTMLVPNACMLLGVDSVELLKP